MINSLGRLLARLVASHVELHPSEQCPDCGSQLGREKADPVAEWRCLNPDCPPQVRARLVLWASPEAMDISGCNESLVARLMDSGLVHDVSEFYELGQAELAALEGVGELKARKLIETIGSSQKREAWRVLFGLGIPKIGSAEARALCRHFDSLHDLFAAGRERVLALEGVSETTARQLNRWLGDPVNRRLVRRLADAGVNFAMTEGTSSMAREAEPK